MLKLNYYMSLLFVLAVISSILPTQLLAQDARELEQERSASKKLKGEHPLLELMRTRKSALRSELLGVHPRVYVTDRERKILFWNQAAQKITGSPLLVR